MENPTTSNFKSKLFKPLIKLIRNLKRKNKKSDDVVAAERSSEQIPPIKKTASVGGKLLKFSSFGEPISPKISCMGQIKHKKKVAKNIHLFLHKDICPAMASKNRCSLMNPTFFLPEEQKIPSNMRNTNINNNGGRKSRCIFSEKGPCLDQIKRFGSFHGGEISDFGWRVTQIEVDDYMDEYKCNYSESEEMKISFSSLIGVVGREDDIKDLEPRKEVNLWRRRTIDQPTPLQITTPCPSLIVHRSRCR